MLRAAITLLVLAAALAFPAAVSGQDQGSAVPPASTGATGAEVTTDASPAAGAATATAENQARTGAEMDKKLQDAEARMSQDLARTRERMAAELAAAKAQVEASNAKLAATEAKLEASDRRMTELEARMAALSANVDKGASDAASVAASVAEQVKALDARGVELQKKTEPLLAFKPYGYIKVDVISDSSRTNSTDSPTFVLQENPGFKDDKQFSITARQTRIGTTITGQPIGEATSTGRIEVDFYGTAANETKAGLQLRQAYWQLTYPTWNVLAGQTWEPISPIFPTTINYPYLALSGNLGHRKPMVRYERVDTVAKDTSFQTDLAVVRGLGSGPTASLDDEASDSGWPAIEAREGLTFPTAISKRLTTVGLSGHVGQEEYDPTAGVPPVVTSYRGAEYMTYSGNLDWTVPVAARWDWKGEFFRGRNLDGYMGGIGQGVNTTLGKPIDSTGGWSQVSFRPAPKWCAGVGYGIDKPDSDDLSAGTPTSPNRSRNSTYFTNVTYNINDRTQIGLEFSYMKTSYILGPDADNFRVQSALQYNF